MKADSTLSKYECDVKYSKKYWLYNNSLFFNFFYHNG